MGRATTLGQLARELRIEPDDVLIALWEKGYTTYGGPNDRVYGSKIREVRAALGLPPGHELGSVQHWQRLSGLDQAGFDSLLGQLGIILGPRSRRLPKGAVRKLRRALREKASEAEREAIARPPVVKVKPRKTFVWSAVGRGKGPHGFLTHDEIEEIHWALVQDFEKQADPISPPGVRDIGLLISAATRPLTSLMEESKYPTVEMAAAALMHSVVNNHPFHNGNKRTAVVAMLVFLDRNGHVLTCDEKELFSFAVRMASHALVPERDSLIADREVQEAARWVAKCCRLVDRNEKLITWRRLKAILRDRGCEFKTLQGNRIKIERRVPTTSRFRIPRRRLQTHVHFGGDGTEVGRSELVKIRRDLELDEEHSIDSIVFYDGKSRPIDEWIGRYRKTLKLLADR